MAYRGGGMWRSSSNIGGIARRSSARRVGVALALGASRRRGINVGGGGLMAHVIGGGGA